MGSGEFGVTESLVEEGSHSHLERGVDSADSLKHHNTFQLFSLNHISLGPHSQNFLGKSQEDFSS